MYIYMHFSVSGFQTSIPLDRFMVYGQDYIDIKTALKQAIFSGNFQPVEAACVKTIPIIAATLVEDLPLLLFFFFLAGRV